MISDAVSNVLPPVTFTKGFKQQPNCGAKCIYVMRYAVRNYHPEAISFCFFLGYAIFQSTFLPAIYQKICHSQFDKWICAHLHGDNEDKVQREATTWQTYLALANFGTSTFSSVFFGSFGDKFGWRIPALVATAATAVYFSLQSIFLYFPVFPLWSFVLLSAIYGIGGGFNLVILVQFAYVANLTHEINGVEAISTKLTFRYTVLASCWSLGYFVGGYLSAVLLELFSFQKCFTVSVGVMTVTFFIVFATYRDKATLKAKTIVLPSETGGQSSANVVPQVVVPEVVQKTSFCTQFGQDFKQTYTDAYHTITKKRLGNRRLYLGAIVFLYVFYGAEDAGIPAILSLYVFGHPLYWTPTTLSYYFGTQNFCDMLGSLITAWVMKKLKFRDSAVAVVGMVSASIRMIFNAVGSYTAVLFVGCFAGFGSTVGFSGLRAFVVELGDSSETGQLISTVTVTSSLAIVFSAVVYNSVYRATLDIWKGTVFAFVAALLLLCAAVMTAIHFDAKKPIRVLQDVETQTETEVEDISEAE